MARTPVLTVPRSWIDTNMTTPATRGRWYARRRRRRARPCVCKLRLSSTGKSHLVSLDHERGLVILRRESVFRVFLVTFVRVVTLVVFVVGGIAVLYLRCGCRRVPLTFRKRFRFCWATRHCELERTGTRLFL